MTHVDWKPYPKMQPKKKEGEYLIRNAGDPNIHVDYWMCVGGIWRWLSYRSVIAWAELPEPYRPEAKDEDYRINK